MRYEDLKQSIELQKKLVSELSDSLNKHKTGRFGFISDTIRFSEEYKNIKAEFEKQFMTLRILNKTMRRMYKNEMYEDRKKNRSRYIGQ